jgi:voltage-gated potassium channel
MPQAADEVVRGSYRARADLGFFLRIAAIEALLLVAYYRAPLDRPLTLMSGLLFAGVLLFLALTVVVEVRGILASRRPLLRAIRTIAVGLPLLLVIFAATYCLVDGQQSDAFSEPLTRTDGLYFAVTTFATVGYGDISPQTELARVLVMVQMVVNLLVVGVIVKVVLGAARMAKDRNTAAERAGGR